MNMDNKQVPVEHTIVIEGRKSVSISGVSDVESFDEQMVILMTDIGELVIKGFGLHINKIDVVTGDLALEGDIYSISYSDTQPAGGGFFGRLFK